MDSYLGSRHKEKKPKQTASLVKETKSKNPDGQLSEVKRQREKPRWTAT